MKKYLILALVALLVALSIASCGKPEEETTSSTTTTTTTTTTVTTTTMGPKPVPYSNVVE